MWGDETQVGPEEQSPRDQSKGRMRHETKYPLLEDCGKTKQSEWSSVTFWSWPCTGLQVSLQRLAERCCKPPLAEVGLRACRDGHVQLECSTGVTRWSVPRNGAGTDTPRAPGSAIDDLKWKRLVLQLRSSELDICRESPPRNLARNTCGCEQRSRLGNRAMCPRDDTRFPWNS
jgi:hypothetical protein